MTTHTTEELQDIIDDLDRAANYFDGHASDLRQSLKAASQILVDLPDDLPSLLAERQAAHADDHPTCACGLLMTQNPHPDAGKPDRLLAVGAVYECVPCLHAALHKASTLRWQAQAERDELERKGVQLCQLAGSMMMACKKLQAVQAKHAAAVDDPCPCAACQIPLPDLSDEAIAQLTADSNNLHAELSALRARAGAADRLRDALEWIVRLCGTENPEEYDHTLHVDILATAESALAPAPPPPTGEQTK